MKGNNAEQNLDQQNEFIDFCKSFWRVFATNN